MIAFRSSATLSRIEISPILALSRRASELRAAGRDVIDMTVGEPDASTVSAAQAAAHAAIDKGLTRYTALKGTDELITAIVAKTRRDLGLDFRSDEVIASNGAKQVIYNALAASLDPGDEVVLPQPCWTSYADMVRLAGGVPVPAAGIWDARRGWRLDADAVAAAVTPRTRWLLINSPSNPTGAVSTRIELGTLASVLDANPHVWVLSDDIYEHIVFDGASAAHILDVAPDLRARTLCVNGVSKAYAMTGWRLGWGVGPPELIRAMTAVQSQISSAPCSISQAAAVGALQGPHGEVTRMRSDFERRRNALAEHLRALDGVEAPSPEGAFYFFPSVKGLIGRCTPDGERLSDDVALCAHLLQVADVAVVPGSAFGAPGWLRMSFALSDAELMKAADRLTKAFSALLPTPRDDLAD